jgi:hypothetical protein
VIDVVVTLWEDNVVEADWEPESSPVFSDVASNSDDGSATESAAEAAWQPVVVIVHDDDMLNDNVPASSKTISVMICQTGPSPMM